MPIDIDFHGPSNRLTISASGVVTFTEAEQAVSQSHRDLLPDGSTSLLIDLRGAEDVKLTIPDLATLMRSLPENFPGLSRRAIVTEKAEWYGFAVMAAEAESLRPHPKGEMKNFRCVVEAETWLTAKMV